MDYYEKEKIEGWTEKKNVTAVRADPVSAIRRGSEVRGAQQRFIVWTNIPTLKYFASYLHNKNE